MKYVTFIGGPLDLTRKAFADRELGRYIRVPVFPDRAVFHDHRADEEGLLQIRTVEYTLMPLPKRDHFAAMLTDEVR